MSIIQAEKTKTEAEIQSLPERGELTQNKKNENNFSHNQAKMIWV